MNLKSGVERCGRKEEVVVVNRHEYKNAVRSYCGKESEGTAMHSNKGVSESFSAGERETGDWYFESEI